MVCALTIQCAGFRGIWERGTSGRDDKWPKPSVPGRNTKPGCPRGIRASFFLDSENPSPIGRFAFKPSMAMRLLLNNSDTVELSRADGGCPHTSAIGVRQPAGAPLACSFPREWRTAAPQLLSLVPQARHKRRLDEEAAVGSTSNLPRWCSGSTGVSKTLGGGSIPSRGAKRASLA